MGQPPPEEVAEEAGILEMLFEALSKHLSVLETMALMWGGSTQYISLYPRETSARYMVRCPYFRGLNMQEWYLGCENVSCLESSPQFRGVLIEGFRGSCTLVQ